MIIFVTNMELSDSDLKILENQSYVSHLPLVLNEPSFHEFLRCEVFEVFEGSEVYIASLVN